jgi:two-component system response regulator HydG
VSHKTRVLIVDDDVGMCETLSDILEDQGYEVVEANNGQQAVDCAKKSDFDLVLMDIKMPGMNGVEACKIIRDERPDVRVVLMTAYAVEDLVQEALKDDAVGIFFKPLDIEKVIKLLQDVKKSSQDSELKVS